MRIKILKKEKALELIENKSFITRWKHLAEESEDFTLTQEYDFVSSWYEAYQSQFDPLLIIAYDKDENISGIMALAISLTNGNLSHAGEEQAEYRAWICNKEDEEKFLINSLILLKKEFNLSQWNWGWMPPNANLNWLHSEKLKKQGIHATIQTFESPRYDLSDLTRINKIKKNKADKSRFNRLKRVGELRIERITDLSIAKEVFVDLKKTYNFRNIAVYNNRAFEDDDFKEQWHLNHLACPDNNVHFTVLWQGDNVLACNFGYCSDTTLVMGVFAYNPVQGANSPGNTFISMLIEYAAEEGLSYLDLTPGGDLYKERFCNSHITLSKAVISFNKVARYKNTSINYLKNKIKEKYSYRDIINFKTSIETKFNDVVKNKSKEITQDETELFEYTPSETKNLIDSSLGFQKFDDLLAYKEHDSSKKHQEIIFSALKNFERRDDLFTLIKESELKMFAWVSTSKRKHMEHNINELIKITEENPFIYDCYLSKDTNKEEASNFIMNIINHYAEAEKTYLLKPPLISKDQMTKAGFTEHKHEAITS